MTSQRQPRLPRLDRLTGVLADAAVRGVDLDAAVTEIDLDAQLERIDVNRLLDRIDPDRLLDRVDPDRLLDRVDPNRLLDRVDPNRLLDRVDPNRLLDRVDPDRLLDRVDPDRLLDRVDVDRLVRRAGIEDIIARSTGQVAGGVLDLVRRQIVAVDLIVTRVLYRVTGRNVERLPAGPDALMASSANPVLRAHEVADPDEVVGRYAGLLPRLLALGADLGLSTAVLSLLAGFVGWILTGVLGLDIEPGLLSGALFGGSLAIWWAIYWISTLSVGGRTPGMGLVGLRLLGADGSTLSLGRVVVWTLVLPLSSFFLGGFLLSLVGSRRQTLHDRAARAAIVYDWGRRGAGAETPLARWIAERDPAATGLPERDVG